MTISLSLFIGDLLPKILEDSISSVGTTQTKSRYIPEPPSSGVSKVYILPVFLEEAEKNFYYLLHVSNLGTFFISLCFNKNVHCSFFMKSLYNMTQKLSHKGRQNKMSFADARNIFIFVASFWNETFCKRIFSFTL